jgi:hypothetical protein
MLLKLCRHKNHYSSDRIDAFEQSGSFQNAIRSKRDAHIRPR